MSSLLVFGAKHLGGAIVDRFAARGHDLATVSLSAETAQSVKRRHPEALTLVADASRPEEVARLVASVQQRFGGIDLAVNCVSPVRSGRVTGGPLDELPADALELYTGELIPAVFNFLRICGGAMARRGSGKLIQVTGGSARRAMSGRGPWAAAAFATRALTNASAQELRKRGVHVSLLIVDAIIESDKTSALLEGKTTDYSASHDDVVDAVEFLAGQSPRGWTHELTLTPRADRWLP